MTRRTLDAVLRQRVRASDTLYLEDCEPPVVLEHGWGLRYPNRYLEEEMNPITVLKMFGQQKVANALAKLLSKMTRKGFELLSAHFAIAAAACEEYDNQAAGAAIAAALFEIK